MRTHKLILLSIGQKTRDLNRTTCTRSTTVGRTTCTRSTTVLGRLDATTAPIRRRGVVAFAARRAKELGADAIIVMQQGQEYAGSISSGSAYTSGFLYNRGFTATTTGTGFSAPLFLGKAEVLAIKWKNGNG
jgi:uncharacterized protein YbjQ (UPF0145 family)